MSLYSFPPALTSVTFSAHPHSVTCPASFPVPAAPLRVCTSSILVYLRATWALSPLSWGRLDGDRPPALLRCPAPQAWAGSSREEPCCFEHFARLGRFRRGWWGAVELVLLGRAPLLRLNASVRVSGRAGGPGEACSFSYSSWGIILTEAHFGKIQILFPFSLSFRMWKSAREESHL